MKTDFLKLIKLENIEEDKIKNLRIKNSDLKIIYSLSERFNSFIKERIKEIKDQEEFLTNEIEKYLLSTEKLEKFINILKQFHHCLLYLKI